MNVFKIIWNTFERYSSITWKSLVRYCRKSIKYSHISKFSKIYSQNYKTFEWNLAICFEYISMSVISELILMIFHTKFDLIFDELQLVELPPNIQVSRKIRKSFNFTKNIHFVPAFRATFTKYRKFKVNFEKNMIFSWPFTYCGLFNTEITE